VLCRILYSFELLGLTREILGKFHELASRRIVPRQTMGQSQASLGFVPEICRIQSSIHGKLPDAPANCCAPASVRIKVNSDGANCGDGDHRSVKVIRAAACSAVMFVETISPEILQLTIERAKF
jgi:hypothetical protein